MMQPEREIGPVTDSTSLYLTTPYCLEDLADGRDQKIAFAVVSADDRRRKIVIALSHLGVEHREALNSALKEAGFSGIKDQRVLSVGGGKIEKRPNGEIIIFDSSKSLNGSVPHAFHAQISALVASKFPEIG
jgi:hypothetical protein